jgi:hypothetical protein
MMKAMKWLALSVLALAFPSVNAHASIPDSNGVYWGCYRDSGSDVILIDYPSHSCPRGSALAHWSQVGPRGPTGLQGVQGPVGPVGPRGTQGVAGPTGSTGATGPQGPAGANGAAGPQGPQGAQGTAGATGLAGRRLRPKLEHPSRRN